MKRKRSAFTLLECIIIFSAGSVLLMVSAGWIHQAMETASITRARQRHHQTLLRLSSQFRDDVRNASSMDLDDESGLRLTVGGDVTRYRIDGSTILMTKQLRDGTKRREKYALDASSVPRWDTSELPDWISLIVTRGSGHLPRQPEQQAVPPRLQRPLELHLRVGVNRWERMLSAGAAESLPKSDDREAGS